MLNYGCTIWFNSKTVMQEVGGDVSSSLKTYDTASLSSLQVEVVEITIRLQHYNMVYDNQIVDSLVKQALKHEGIIGHIWIATVNLKAKGHLYAV